MWASSQGWLQAEFQDRPIVGWFRRLGGEATGLVFAELLPRLLKSNHCSGGQWPQAAGADPSLVEEVSGIAASVWPQALTLQPISTRSVRTRRAQLPTCDEVCESQPGICCRRRFSGSCASAKTSENFGVLPSATTPFIPARAQPMLRL